MKGTHNEDNLNRNGADAGLRPGNQGAHAEPVGLHGDPEIPGIRVVGVDPYGSILGGGDGGALGVVEVIDDVRDVHRGILSAACHTRPR